MTTMIDVTKQILETSKYDFFLQIKDEIFDQCFDYVMQSIHHCDPKDSFRSINDNGICSSTNDVNKFIVNFGKLFERVNNRTASQSDLNDVKFMRIINKRMDNALYSNIKTLLDYQVKSINGRLEKKTGFFNQEDQKCWLAQNLKTNGEVKYPIAAHFLCDYRGKEFIFDILNSEHHSSEDPYSTLGDF